MAKNKMSLIDGTDIKCTLSSSRHISGPTLNTLITQYYDDPFIV